MDDRLLSMCYSFQGNSKVNLPLFRIDVVTLDAGEELIFLRSEEVTRNTTSTQLTSATLALPAPRPIMGKRNG